MRLKITALALAVMCLICGCTINDRQVFFSLSGPFTVMSIGPLSCKKAEARLYYVNYKNLYDTVGETNLWDGDFDLEEVEEGIFKAAINHLCKVYVLNLYAKEADITLDYAQKNAAALAARQYEESLSEEEIKKLGINSKNLKRMVERYALAEIVYTELMNTVDEEVSEDEARIMDAYVLYTTNKKLFKKLGVQIKNGATFERLVATYSQQDKGIVSFGRGTYPKKVEKVAFSLENDEISDGIKAKDGYYYIQCKDKYNEKLSEENKASIISSRKADVLKQILDDQYEKYDSMLNERMLKRIENEDYSGVETDSFFSTIESYL